MRLIILNLVVICCSLYFSFHIVYGPKSYFEYIKLSYALENKHKYYTDLVSNKVILESRASLLNKVSLDIDTLDEYARKILGLAAPKDIIISMKGY